MSWKEKYQTGSFRGVEFKTSTHTNEGGRRTQTYEFVDRDTPFTEDNGRKARSYSIEIYIIGDDYFTQRDALIAAFEQRGPGELIHPYLGTLEVNLTSYSLTEDKTEGRIARFSLTFVETGNNIYPSIEEDRAATLLDFAEASLNSAQSLFEENFSVLGQPGFVIDAARSLVDQAANAFESASQVVSDSSNLATELAFSVRNLKAEANDLIQSPGILGQVLRDSISLLSGVATNANDASSAYSSLFDYESKEVFSPFETDARKQQNKNKKAMDDYIKNMAIILATEEAIDKEFTTVAEAIDEQQKLKELINRQSDESEDINFFQNMNDLSASLVKAVPDIENELPNVILFTPQETTNSLVLSYEIFEDVDQESDIIQRNNIKNPSFIIGGEALEVLNV